MKIIILASPKPNSKPYSNLEPIVEALLDAGNKLSDPPPNFRLEGKGFYIDKDGWKCDLKKPIDFNLITSKFQLPPSVIISEKNNSIFCQDTWVEIRGNCNGLES